MIIFGRLCLAAALVLALGAAQLACTPLEPEPGSRSNPVIYGQDDRIDYYQATGAQRGAADSVFAIVMNNELSCSGGQCTLLTVPYNDWFSPPLCMDEPFRDQPTIGFCSAFLVGGDLMATAGHCVNTKDCSKISFIPRFRVEAAGGAATTVIPQSEIYNCVEKIARQNKRDNDYGVWRLDRTVTGLTPLCVRRTGTVAAGQSLEIMGYPYSLPLKIAGGAEVKAVYSKFFTANLDDYGGNSGSPVFDPATYEVQGILVRGNEDYVYDSANACWRSNVCSDTGGCAGTFEQATHAKQFVSNIPLVACYTPATCVVNADCDDSNPCTVDTCSAGACSNAAGNIGTVCRASAGICDMAETCNGADTACPTDLTVGDGTSCTDGDACNGDETCQAGACAAGTPMNCDDGNLCTVDSCSAGACSNVAGNGGTVCRASAGACDVAETCDGFATTCPANGYQTDGSSCADGDVCDGVETCQTGVCTAAGQPAAEGTPCNGGACDGAGTCASSCLGSSGTVSNSSPAAYYAIGMQAAGTALSGTLSCDAGGGNADLFLQRCSKNKNPCTSWRDEKKSEGDTCAEAISYTVPSKRDGYHYRWYVKWKGGAAVDYCLAY